MTTKRKQKKRNRAYRNAMRRLLATPDSELDPVRQARKKLLLALEFSICYGDSRHH